MYALSSEYTYMYNSDDGLYALTKWNPGESKQIHAKFIPLFKISPTLKKHPSFLISGIRAIEKNVPFSQKWVTLRAWMYALIVSGGTRGPFH